MLLVQHEDANQIKQIFQVISSFITEIEIICDEEGFKLVAIDDSHVCMVNVNLPPSFFKEYKTEGEDYSLKIDCENFVKILQQHRSGDELTLSYTGDGDKLYIQMNKEGRKGSRNFSFSLLDDINAESINLEGLLSYDMQVTTFIDPSIIHSTLKAAEIFGEVLQIIVRDIEDEDEKELVFKCTGNLGELEDIVDPEDLKDSVFNQNFSWSYTIHFLKEIIKSQTFAKKTKIRLGVTEGKNGLKAIPIRFDFYLEEIEKPSKEGTEESSEENTEEEAEEEEKSVAEINFFLAPRKPKAKGEGEEDEEEEEEDE